MFYYHVGLFHIVLNLIKGMPTCFVHLLIASSSCSIVAMKVIRIVVLFVLAPVTILLEVRNKKKVCEHQIRNL